MWLLLRAKRLKSKSESWRVLENDMKKYNIDCLGRIECSQRQLITFESLRSCQQTIEFSITSLLC